MRKNTAMKKNVRSKRRVRLRSSLLALSLTGLTAAGLTACSMDIRDHECMSNEYPVQAIGPQGGGACATNGQAPPKGYVRYPKGQVPQRVGDKWDTYWNSHGLDANGKLIKN